MCVLRTCAFTYECDESTGQPRQCSQSISTTSFTKINRFLAFIYLNCINYIIPLLCFRTTNRRSSNTQQNIVARVFAPATQFIARFLFRCRTRNSITPEITCAVLSFKYLEKSFSFFFFFKMSLKTKFFAIFFRFNNNFHVTKDETSSLCLFEYFQNLTESIWMYFKKEKKNSSKIYDLRSHSITTHSILRAQLVTVSRFGLSIVRFNNNNNINGNNNNENTHTHMRVKRRACWRTRAHSLSS